MTDKELCERFGITLEEVDKDAEKYESGNLDDYSFGEPTEGLPGMKMKTTSFKLYEFELAAIDREAKKQGISRSAFIRLACDNELLARA